MPEPEHFQPGSSTSTVAISEMPYREDIITLRPPKKLVDGRLRFDAHLTRTGVFEYVEPGGGIRREYRPPREVFDRASLSAFEGVVVTNEHPSEMITLGNASRFRVGQVGESVRRDGDHVAGTLYVDDPVTIDQMQRSHRPKSQVSVGYHVELDETPGVSPEGDRYDAVQRQILPNHVAIVERGRAGTAHVRMDSATLGEPFAVAFQQEKKKMAERTDKPGTTQALADALSRITKFESELKVQTARADAAEGRVAGLEETIKQLRSERTDSDRIADIEVERDQLKQRADAAEQALAQVPELVNRGVQRRVKILNGAIAVLGEKDGDKPRRFDDLNDRQIMETVVLKASGVDLSERSEDYVEARFDACVEAYAAGSNAMQAAARATTINQRAAAEASRTTQNQKREDAARARGPDAWRKPLPSSVIAGQVPQK